MWNFWFSFYSPYKFFQNNIFKKLLLINGITIFIYVIFANLNFSAVCPSDFLPIFSLFFSQTLRWMADQRSEPGPLSGPAGLLHHRGPWRGVHPNSGGQRISQIPRGLHSPLLRQSVGTKLDEVSMKHFGEKFTVSNFFVNKRNFFQTESWGGFTIFFKFFFAI